jgi:hypothetical protein
MVRRPRSVWYLAHESQASRCHVRRNDARHGDEWTHATLVRRWCLTHSAREEDAEASEAREADFHADLGDRVLSGCQQLPGEFEPGRLSKLMRCCAEDRLELPDEMKGRDLNVSGELVDRERLLARFEQQVAGATETTESFVPEEHAQ